MAKVNPDELIAVDAIVEAAIAVQAELKTLVGADLARLEQPSRRIVLEMLRHCAERLGYVAGGVAVVLGPDKTAVPRQETGLGSIVSRPVVGSGTGGS